VADTSFAGESAAILAEHQARLRIQEDIRKRAARRSAAGAAVAVVHVIFVAVLIASEWIPLPLVKPDEQQPLSWIVLPQIARAANSPPIKPRKPEDNGSIRPFVLPQLVRPPEEENNAITDLGWALGRSLACGANSFEYLNTKMRNECKHRPWQFVYDRYGNIVLDAVPRIPHEEKPRPSDVQARERNTAPRCPQNIDPNAPCLANVIGGRP
jgi:hypothetical protein